MFKKKTLSRDNPKLSSGAIIKTCIKHRYKIFYHTDVMLPLISAKINSIVVLPFGETNNCMTTNQSMFRSMSSALP